MHSRIAINPDGGPSDPEPDPLIKKSNPVIHLTDYVLRNVVFLFNFIFIKHEQNSKEKNTITNFKRVGPFNTDKKFG